MSDTPKPVPNSRTHLPGVIARSRPGTDPVNLLAQARNSLHEVTDALEHWNDINRHNTYWLGHPDLCRDGIRFLDDLDFLMSHCHADFSDARQPDMEQELRTVYTIREIVRLAHKKVDLDRGGDPYPASVIGEEAAKELTNRLMDIISVKAALSSRASVLLMKRVPPDPPIIVQVLKQDRGEEREGPKSLPPHVTGLPTTGPTVLTDAFGAYRIEDRELVLSDGTRGKIDITPGEKKALVLLMTAGKKGVRPKEFQPPWPSFRTHVSDIKAKLKGNNVPDYIRTPEEPGPFQGEGYAIWPE